LYRRCGGKYYPPLPIHDTFIVMAIRRSRLAKCWCWTLNNPDQDHVELLTNLKPHVVYVVFQKEKGECDQTEHYQGFMELKKRSRLTAIKKYMPRAHLEAMQGTRSQAREYCMKEESRIDGPWEYGIWKSTGQGRRTDLHVIDEKIKSGATIAQICDEHGATYMKFHRGIEKLVGRKQPVRTEPCEVVLCWGPPGTGKTKWAKRHGQDKTWVLPIGGNMWFDGYEQQPIVVLDDFNGASSHFKLDDLLRLIDPWCCERVPVKGSFTWWCPDKIYITTNIHPFKWYKYEDRRVHYDALQRRITSIRIYSEDHEPFEYDVVDDPNTFYFNLDILDVLFIDT